MKNQRIQADKIQQLGSWLEKNHKNKVLTKTKELLLIKEYGLSEKVFDRLFSCYRTAGSKPTKISKAIEVIDKESNLIYPTIKAAAEANNIKPSTLKARLAKGIETRFEYVV